MDNQPRIDADGCAIVQLPPLLKADQKSPIVLDPKHFPRGQQDQPSHPTGPAPFRQGQVSKAVAIGQDAPSNLLQNFRPKQPRQGFTGGR